MTRAGARPGDRVVLAGRVGWAAAGLAVLARGFRSPRVLVEAYRRPDPPYALGPVLAAAGATAMCDVSDGLVQDLGHIAEASGVGIDIDRASLYMTDALRDVGNALNADPYDWLLSGGDDHALVATLPPDVEPPAVVHRHRYGHRRSRRARRRPAVRGRRWSRPLRLMRLPRVDDMSPTPRRVLTIAGSDSGGAPASRPTSRPCSPAACMG